MKTVLLGLWWGLKAVAHAFVLAWVYIQVTLSVAAFVAPIVVTSLVWSYNSVGVFVMFTELGLTILFLLGSLFGGEWDSRGRWIGWKK